MPQYLSPGVYVEEVPSTARPIAGVGTSTAGFIGVVVSKEPSGGNQANSNPNQESASPRVGTSSDVVKMPLKPGKTGKNADGTAVEPTHYYTVAPAGEPRLITSWEEFKNNFGDIQRGNAELARAVYGFFNNGGTRCWVIGVAANSFSSLGDSLKKFAGIDEIAIVAAPGATTKAQQEALLDHCENIKTCVAILDGASTKTGSDLAKIRSSSDTAVRDSAYGALYYPWITVLDPATGATIAQPPSGHVAGIYARVDATRGVHKAPANEAIRGALDLERRLSKADQDGLNPTGINAIRAFDGAIKVFGARTLGGDANTDFKYISTRRFFNFLRQSIDHGTQWVVFEPNTPALWQSISRNVTAFLTGVWRSGALFGNTAQEAFYVKCDADTNPPDQRDLGIVVTEVGVSIVRPAEFVIFRLSQWAGPGK